jgi:hypothetical protein
MFEKEIILKEQLAAHCLYQCSPARKLPASAGFGLLKGELNAHKEVIRFAEFAFMGCILSAE